MGFGEVIYLLAYVTLIILVIILQIILIKDFIIPRIHCFIRENIPLCMVTTSTKKGAILKKYAHGMVVDKDDQSMIDRLASIGLMHTGIHEKDLPNNKITLVPTARTTGRGLRLLRHHLV